MKSNIEALLAYMVTDDDKLALLTCIGLGTDSEELFAITEELRFEVCNTDESLLA